jgi:serine/threonine protein kinase/tetratricopeptide (TPR) repeat protein
MNTGPSSRVEELFHAALERDPEDRAAFLTEACGDDPLLEEDVKSLLAVYGEAQDFPDRPAWAMLFQEQTADISELEVEPGLPFERLGEFRLIRKIGEGGMGVVFLAVQESLGRQVALKVIRPERAGSFEAETRFKREVESIADVRHPNIVTVFASGEEKGVRYFAMELVSGNTLSEILREGSSSDERLPLPVILGWFAEIAEALDCAHQAGIIHRDVKPSNVRISPEGRAMLMDFGVAQHANLASLTLTGEFRGTPHYASPEQVKAIRDAIDARTDVYSLGVTLYEAVVGRIPFEGATTEQVFQQILQQEPVSPRRLKPSIPRDLETVIVTAMEKEPGRRYQTMAGFARDLRRLLAGEPALARPAGWPRRSVKWVKRHKFLSLFSAALLIVLASAAFFVQEISKQREEKIKVVRACFKPINEAMEISDFFSWDYVAPWWWCIEADPRDPAGYMLRSLHEIGSGEPEKSLGSLKECIKYCRLCNDDDLEKDAHYLLGIARLLLAEAAGSDSERKRKLRDEAEQALEQSGIFNPASEKALIWREADFQVFTSGGAELSVRDIKINSRHSLVQLWLGLYLFTGLHNGGELNVFLKTIDYFEAALLSDPDSVIAWCFLGRTYYFFARYFDFMDLTTKAEECLAQALRIAGDHASHIIYNTLGATCLAQGKNADALEYNQRILADLRGEWPTSIHNTFSGIGKVYARQGRFSEAIENYNKALKRQTTDVHTINAMAELFLMQGDTDKALKYLLNSNSIDPNLRASIKRYPLHSSAFLLCSRIYLERGEYSEAQKALTDLFIKAVHSPRDFSLACILIATFPEEWLRSEDDKPSKLVRLAARLVGTVLPNARFEDRKSPVWCSGRGVCALLLGRYETAIADFEEALRERKKWWARETREYLWTEDVRDFYFLAMAHFELARLRGSVGGKAHEAKAHAFFEKAEARYRRSVPPIEIIDIIKRVRSKTMEVLGKKKRR